MKRMIDNKDYELLKNNVNDINEELELKDTDYIITSVIVEGEEVEGFIIKDVKNEVNYNIAVGGGGKQLYQHNIRLYDAGKNMYLPTIICDKSTSFTFTELFEYLYNSSFAGYDKGYQLTGDFIDSDNNRWIYDNLSIHHSTFGYAKRIKLSDGSVLNEIISSISIEDIVKAI